eukprot:gb/GECG01013383.1/.p1 GENE.gb/GECG01013383.1/~~gb/GECG01013383.1/.p1  ORF type:complete len:435 (+),score=59.62 gb/GECG01013383.1/:1-1305(+)
MRKSSRGSQETKQRRILVLYIQTYAVSEMAAAATPLPKLVRALQEQKDYFIGACTVKDGMDDELNTGIDTCLELGGKVGVREMDDEVAKCISVPSEQGIARKLAEENFEALRRELIVACFLARDSEARVVFEEGKLKRVFLGNEDKKATEKVKAWWEENASIFKAFEFSGLQSSLIGLIRYICKHEEEEPTEGIEKKMSEFIAQVTSAWDRQRNPWDHFTQTSPARCKDFAHKVKSYYFGEYDNKRKKYSVARPKCQLTGARTNLRAAHLCPVHGSAIMSDWGLYPEDINDPRNGLYLSDRVEELFDRRRLTFLWDFIRDIFYSVVLDPKVRNDEPKLHQKRLKFPTNHRPWKRILVNHSKSAFDYWKNGNHKLQEVDGKVLLGTHANGTEFWLFEPSEYPNWKFSYFESVETSDMENIKDSDDWVNSLGEPKG